MPCSIAAVRACEEGTRGGGNDRQAALHLRMAMDKKELETFARALLGPARIVNLKDRLLSQEWRCSSCGLVVESAEPVPVPAPCPRCRGIAFETVDPLLQ